MIVSKLYWRLLKKNGFVFILYLGIFLMITILTAQSLRNNNTQYEDVKVKVALYDEDQTTFTDNIKDYLKDYVVFKDIDRNRVDDAFFYREVEVVVIIPEGFTTNFFNSDVANINIKVLPESTKAFTFEQVINKYLNLVRVYQDNDLINEDYHTEIKEILAKEVMITLPESNLENYILVHFYYNYVAYIAFALITTLMGTIMATFKSLDIKRRNNIGSISNRKMNLVLLVCNTLLGLGVLGILIALSIILYKDLIFNLNTFYLIINSLIYTVTIIALTYFIIALFDSRQIIGAIANVLSLGSAFITGVFIPQEFLNKGILYFAQIFPSFWFIKANDYLADLTHFDLAILKPAFQAFLVQIIMAIVFIGLSLIISKRKQLAEN